MYGSHSQQRPAFGGLLRVASPEDLEYLVKESEVTTGRPGRKFVVAGADRLCYQVQWHPTGFTVQFLDERGAPACTMFMLREQFDEHCLGEALRAGQLFTVTLN